MQKVGKSGSILTCLSGSMLANPPEWLAWPPLLAMFWTSSFGLLAKLPGFSLDVAELLEFSLDDIMLTCSLQFG